MAGCLVSAAELTGSITASAPYAYAGDTSITVPVTIIPSANVYITRIKVTSTLGTVASATVEGENVKPLEATNTNLEGGIILVEASTEAGYSYATVNLVFNNAEGFAAGDYSVNLENITTIEGSDYDENGVVYTCEGVEFTLAERFGTATNPHVVEDTENPRANNFALVEGTTYFTLPAVTGKSLSVSSYAGEFTVSYNGVEYASEYVMAESTYVVSIDPMVDGVLSFTASGVADNWVTVRLVAPPAVGSVELPEVITKNGDYTATVAEGSQGYYYTYTATEAGTVTVTMPDGNWFYVINNLTAGTYGDNQWSDSDPVVNPASVDVAAGDEIQIIVNTYDPAAWATPAGSVNWIFAFSAAQTGPTVDDALVIAGASLGFGDSSLKITFRMRKTVVESYPNMELVFVPQKYDTSTTNLIETPTEVVVPSSDFTVAGNFYTYEYTDIQLYELGLNINYFLRATDAEGNVFVSSAVDMIPSESLKTLYKGSTATDALKTLITDILVAGDKAADFFAKEGSHLATATSIIEGFDTSKASVIADTYVPNTIDDADFKADYGTDSSCTHRVAKSVAIGKAPYINYRITDRNKVLDLSKISIKVTYNALNFAGEEKPYSKTFTSADANIARSGNFVTFKFDEIGLGDSCQNIVVEISYDGDVVHTNTYAMEAYLNANMSDPTLGAITTALMKLGIGFRGMAN